MFSAKAFIFDIDGTLLNCRDGVHYQAFRSALQKIFGVDSDLSGVAVHGNTDPGILRAVLANAGVSPSDAQITAALEHMRDEVLRNQEQIAPQVCAAVPAVLEKLAAQKKLLAVASGNLEAVGWAKLRAAGLRDYFAFGCFSDRGESRAQIVANALREAQFRLARSNGNKFAENSVCIVGDTPADIAAARACGGQVIAVATGIYSRDQLAAHQPDLCLNCCEELLA